MEEIYTFDARVAERWASGEVQIEPEDREAFLAYHKRARLDTRPDWYDGKLYVTVGAREFIANSQGAERVRYSVQAREIGGQRQMWGVALEAI